MKFLVIVASCLLAFGFFPASAATLEISEFMPDNQRTLADEDGAFPDWIELHNAGPDAVNLLGWYLTDSPTLLTKWSFPSVNLAAGGFLVVFASGKDRTGNPARLHTNFKLDNAGGYLALVRPDGTNLASVFAPYPAAKEDVARAVVARRRQSKPAPFDECRTANRTCRATTRQIPAARITVSRNMIATF